MRLLMTASQIRGLPVVTVRGGEDVAEVRDVIYSPEAGRLVGVTLNKRGFLAGRSRDVLPAEAIHAIGQHAVMVLDDSSLVAPEDAPDDVAHPAVERNVIGDDVLTEGGSSLGKVTDLVLLVGSSGEVVGYQIDKTGGGRGYIPLPAQLAVSGAALVVPNITEEFVQDDLVGLGAVGRRVPGPIGVVVSGVVQAFRRPQGLEPVQRKGAGLGRAICSWMPSSGGSPPLSSAEARRRSWSNGSS